MGIAFKAMQCARTAHKNQVRKYTDNPYVDHLAEVAGIVSTVSGWDVACALYFDDELVGSIRQSARRSDLFFEFLSEALAHKLRDYVASGANPKLSIIDPTEEVDTHYTVTYSSQLLVTGGVYNGQPVEVVKKFDDYCVYNNWRFVEIKDHEGTTTRIALDEFKIPLRLKESTND